MNFLTLPFFLHSSPILGLTSLTQIHYVIFTSHEVPSLCNRPFINCSLTSKLFLRDFVLKHS
jgi:hypothetical protein